MDDKNKARLMRELADKVDEVASLCRTLGWYGFEGHYLSNAEHHRLQADRADPPVVWEKGDYATDKNNDLWQYSGNGVWFRNGIVCKSTEKLEREAGPLRKVKMVPVDEHSE